MPSPNTNLLPVLRGFFAHFSRRRRIQLGLLVILMLIGAVAELLTLAAVIPFIALMAEPERAFEFGQLQALFGALGWERPETIVLPMTILFLAIVLAASSIRLLLTWSSNRFIYAVGFDLSVALYDRVLHQPYQYHVARNTSEVIAAVTKVQAVIGGVMKPLMQAAIGSIISVAIVTGLIIIDPLVATSAGLIFAVMYLIIVRITRSKLRFNSKVIAEAQTQRVRAVQEGLGGIRDVLLDGVQGQYVRGFAKVDGRLRKAQVTNAFIGAAPRYLLEAIGIVLIVGIAFVMASTTGGLVGALPVLGALALGAQRLLPLLQQIYNGWTKLMGNRQVMVDVVELLDLPKPTSTDAGDPERLSFTRELRMDAVWFHYERASEWVLQDFSLPIPRGSRVGLVGRTGSGKTTAMDILMGLLEPVRGRILVDGVEITNQNRAAWQRKIAHVPQFIYLTDASITENIAFGVPLKEIDHNRVREAARRAQIAEFIESSGRGYDAHVGERGIQLSGGQRQRIGIARALYKNAEILVFDEATSALDHETEESVMNCIDELDKNLTILMIAHRVQTLRFCDQVVHLEKGQIIHSGTYQQVIEAAEESTHDNDRKRSSANA